MQYNMEVSALEPTATSAKDHSSSASMGSSTYHPLFRKPSKRQGFLQLQRSREIERESC
ncbi:hypothetical protein E2C01_064107 [Portunus trituberculatus]|uniref:Uncharacterized protein n=1 Tax=Portunus trituberculatus TaxID=210409 RepID=A0A5B7HJZ2_PORTR|nr:hypothetical protein [Portunus trituberculatus]